ncbi:DUF6232 family protein [Antribacter sp. KLBMP9083]|uniref:DUF6232 family protein n=1 Tax=Antribacter soli TaxID=2910976 RepID=A0AA41UDF7_9MICO|nr:DUF6232 family protein [Antribacter soli]MCF4123044.1 DUF6232 family protein [Antribacter soli]
MPHISRQNVRIVRRTLWIGQDTYPLHNVVKTSLRRVTVAPRTTRPGRATRWGFGLSLLGSLWLVGFMTSDVGSLGQRLVYAPFAVGHIALMVFTFRALRGRVPFPHGWKWPVVGLAAATGPLASVWLVLTDPVNWVTVVGLYAWPAVVLLIWSLVARRPPEARTYHQLIVTTSGGESTRLTSDDGHALQQLRGALTRAINDPKTSYSGAMNVYEFAGGDNVVIVGDNNVGVVRDRATGISRG